MNRTVEEMVKKHAPNLYSLMNLPQSKWRKIDKKIEQRKEYVENAEAPVIGNFFDIIESASEGIAQPKAILEYTEFIAKELNDHLPEVIKSKLRKNGSQIFDPSVDGKQVFYERLAELRLLQQFGTQSEVTIQGIDVKMEESAKDVDLVVVIEEKKYYLEFITIRLDPERIESEEGVADILRNRLEAKKASKFSDVIPKDGTTMIIPTIFTNIGSIKKFKEIFKSNPQHPFAGIVPFFYVAFSGVGQSGKYIYRIEEAYNVLLANNENTD